MISLYKTTYLKAEQKLAEDYQAKRHAAIQAQRNGNLGDYVYLSREAEAIAIQLEGTEEEAPHYGALKSCCESFNTER